MLEQMTATKPFMQELSMLREVTMRASKGNIQDIISSSTTQGNYVITVIDAIQFCLAIKTRALLLLVQFKNFLMSVPSWCCQFTSTAIMFFRSRYRLTDFCLSIHLALFLVVLFVGLIINCMLRASLFFTTITIDFLWLLLLLGITPVIFMTYRFTTITIDLPLFLMRFIPNSSQSIFPGFVFSMISLSLLTAAFFTFFAKFITCGSVKVEVFKRCGEPLLTFASTLLHRSMGRLIHGLNCLSFRYLVSVLSERQGYRLFAEVHEAPTRQLSYCTILSHRLRSGKG